MALTYTTFQTYPLEIAGISSEYNLRIAAIENFVIEDLAYSGDAADVGAILKYFVFWFFCQNATTTVTPESGENSQVKEFSTPEIFKQVQAWNIGVDKLRLLCGITDEIVNERWIQPYTGLSLNEFFKSILDSASITINQKYLSKRSLL